MLQFLELFREYFIQVSLRRKITFREIDIATYRI